MNKMNGLFKMLLFYWLSMFLLVDNLKAQSSWEEVVEQLASQGEEGSYNLETLFEELEDWKAHPVNINSATTNSLMPSPLTFPSHSMSLSKKLRKQRCCLFFSRHHI